MKIVMLDSALASHLVKRCQTVTEFGERIVTWATEMALLCQGIGVGLAAPQVALTERFFVMRVDPNDETNQSFMTVVNPSVVHGTNPQTDREGCLSIPWFTGDVERMSVVETRYQDAFGNVVEQTFRGLAARVFLHETDHLDGVLFISRASKLYHKQAHVA